MNVAVRHAVDTADAAEITRHLTACDAHFIPRLSARVDIADYARKLWTRASRFEAWVGPRLIGLVAAYADDERRDVFVTSVSVLGEWRGRGIATRLIEDCVAQARGRRFGRVTLEVSPQNPAALALYLRCGFTPQPADGAVITMWRQVE